MNVESIKGRVTNSLGEMWKCITIKANRESFKFRSDDSGGVILAGGLTPKDEFKVKCNIGEQV